MQQTFYIRELRDAILEKPLPPRTDNERRSLNLSFKGVTVEGREENFEGIERLQRLHDYVSRNSGFQSSFSLP